MLETHLPLAAFAAILLCSTLLPVPSSAGAATANAKLEFPVEFDFRFTTYEELLSESFVFDHDDIVGFTQLTLDLSNSQLLVGARDSLFRLALDNLEPLEHVEIGPQEKDFTLCTNKGQKQVNCRNYVRVLLLHNYTLTNPTLDVDNAVFVCGTYAFAPQCSWRPASNLSHVLETVSGVGKAPYNPNHNSTAIITTNGDYYGATVLLPGDRDPIIYRSKGTPKTKDLRTAQYNSKWLNEPDFISAYEIGDFVYFFFREVAVEFINCGKRIFSRVARVCKTDEGGFFSEKVWTTYFKARLNCSLPGEYPFYYDEIQSTFYLEEENDVFIYAVFNTPANSIAGSAVCVFNLTALNDSFTGPFKYQDTPRSAWERHDNPNPLTQCPSESKEKRDSDKSMMMESKYQLMDNAVQPTTRVPFVHAQNERYTHIVVDNVAAKNTIYKVIFVATADGKIQKLTKLPNTGETCLIEEIKIVPNGEHKPVKAMKIVPSEMAIYIATFEKVIKVPVHRCSRFKNSDLCLNGNDPYCGWNEYSNKCTVAPSGQPNLHFWYQSMGSCPFIHHPVDGQWSEWSKWGNCSQVGGDPSAGSCLCRSRSCDDPKPYYGGKDCVGASVEVTNCTAHGQWTEWTSWSSCSKSCGSDALRYRQRFCSNPPPRFGGLPCLDKDKQEEYCSGHPPCPLPPVQGSWNEWADWSDCSGKCNGGIQTRRRSCHQEPPVTERSIPCVGNTQEWRMCNTQVCEELHSLTPWTPWGAVNFTNGGHFEERHRFKCRASVPSHNMIKKAKASKSQTRFCVDNGTCHTSDVSLLDDIDGHWSDWSHWSECSSKCNSGLKWRERSCDNPKPLGKGHQCEGHTKEGMGCNTHSCQGIWSCWSKSTQCSVTCGQGVVARVRQCQTMPPGRRYSIPCPGNSQEYITCDMGPCPDIIALSSSTGNQQGTFEKPRFSLAQLLLVGALSFILGGSASLAFYAYIQSFRRAMKDAKNKERVERLEKAMREQKNMERKLSRMSGRPLPSLSSQASLDNSSFVSKSRMYNVETMMRDSMVDREEPLYSTIDRQCTLKTFVLKDL